MKSDGISKQVEKKKGLVYNVLEGCALLAPGEEGINGLTISNAIHLSDWTGNAWVELPLDGDKYLNLLEERRKNSKTVVSSNVMNLEGSRSKKGRYHVKSCNHWIRNYFKYP